MLTSLFGFVYSTGRYILTEVSHHPIFCGKFNLFVVYQYRYFTKNSILMSNSSFMTINQILQQEIKDSELWLSRTYEDSTYKRDLKKRIELINWVLGNMKNPNVEICSLIEARMNVTIKKINKKDSIFEADPLESEIRTLDWIFYQICKMRSKENNQANLAYRL